MNRLLALLLTVMCASGLSCSLNDYCLQCTKDAGGDGGVSDADAGGDATDASTCVPTGDEECDGKDNDCDGLIDEGVLPGVGDLCDNQMGECAGGVKQCTPTYHCSVSTTKACLGANDTTSCPSGETCNADDASTNHITCSKNPKPELCDGKDNNCNGMVDEGNPLTDMNGNSFASKCGPSGGTCVQGQNICAVAPNCGGSGQPACGTISCVGAIGPQPEQCDTLDNDCDGNIDEDLTNLGTCGAPEPGCASPPCGLCKLGTLQCADSNMGMTASIVCMGAVNPTFELCNGKDDDCDGATDEDFNLMTDANNCGSCGHVCGAGLTNAGNADWACSAGQCVITSCKAGYHNNNGLASDGCEFGQCFASGPEVCDGQDNDCDGVIDEMGAIGAAPPICATQGACAGTVASCPCMNTADSAGCTTGGACTTSCAMPSGWKCTYGGNVSTDSNGNIIAETKCDGIDNDCNGIIDDNQPPMAHADTNTTFMPPACNDGKLGICEGFGNMHCDDGTFTGSTPGGNLTGPALCDVTSPGKPKGTESCNNLDDDCDGVVDNGANTGNLPGQEWIDIGNGHKMMRYEASRPDATSTDGGTVSVKACNTASIASVSESGASATFTTSAAHGFTTGQVVTVAGVTNTAYNGTWQITSVPTITTFTATLASSGLAPSSSGTASTNCVATCSTAGRQPWTNITYEQALSACQAVGATLCSESTWHRTCSAVSSQALPVSVPSSTSSGALIEVEDYLAIAFATSGTTTHSWVEDETPGFSGISNMEAQPVSGGNIAIGSANGASPRLDYQVTFPAAGTYRIFLHMFANTNNGGNFFSAYVGMGATAPVTPTLTFKNTSTASWQWIGSTGTAVAAGTTSMISLYMGDPGVKVDAIYITTNTGTPTITLNPIGNKWAMQPTTGYTANVCNDQNYTGTGAGGPLASGTLTSCYSAVGTNVFDLSGNVKEWTLAHQPGQNPIRGGAFNNTANGIDCPLNFTLADDTFFFNDVGFRCCK